MILLWLCIGVLTAEVLFLLIRIFLMRKSIGEISEELKEKIETDTNTRIHLSSGDRRLKELAADLNGQLKILRAERLRYQQGDRELKEAVTNISHDLRTPLTAICGYLELLEKENKSPEAERYLAIISERVSTLRNLTEELLKYSLVLSKSEDMPREDTVINHVLEESISAFYASLKEKGIHPRIQICEKKIHRNLNKNALLRIFSNVLSNAVKYSDGDLSITLSEQGGIRFQNHSAKLDEIRTGRLFDRFYTVETADGQSTGLGLSIAKTLTERMDGCISAEYHGGIVTIEIIFREP